MLSRRKRLMCSLAISLLVARLPVPAQARASFQQSIDPNELDAKAFAVLFRRVNIYADFAGQAKSSTQPEANLLRVIPQRFHLTDADAESLGRLAARWKQDRAPLELEAKAFVASYRASVPANSFDVDTPVQALSGLRRVRAQMDVLTLHYRDSLRNAMSEIAYQTLRTQLETTFANNQMRSGN